jgi:uncharacterized membrane protein
VNRLDLNLSTLGWIHTLASLCALAAGAVILILPKGTLRHRSVGKVYVAAASVTSLSALGIYRHNVFFFPHWLAVASLALITIGLLCAHSHRPKRLWSHAHLTSMVGSYYLLVGGGVNEAFLRIDLLHSAVPRILNSLLVAIVHGAVAAAFVALVVAFNMSRLARSDGG